MPSRRTEAAPAPFEVPITPKSPTPLTSVVEPGVVERLAAAAQDLRARLDGRLVWNVNSTASGGGVAEMLHSLLPYARGLGIDTRWIVIGGVPDFFRVTKRLHNALHGQAGDGSDLGKAEAAVYQRVTDENAAGVRRMVGPRDVVILHDPQTAGLAKHLAATGATVIWRCHIGDDRRSDEADRGWAFLAPHLAHAKAFVFSRSAYVPAMCDSGRSVIVPPSIDPFSPKNVDMDPVAVRAILVRIGLIAGTADEERAVFLREGGAVALVRRRAEKEGDDPLPGPDDPLVVQVSRWDRLKDPVGVLEGFSRLVNGTAPAGSHLVLAGPNVKGVTDDPEGAQVYEEVVARWRALPASRRSRVHLVNLPMDDLEENAAMVNALQRHAAVIVQKSLREGFGLTVTEAMWKSRAVVASAVGGIKDQVEDGVSGLLVNDPSDLDACAAAMRRILEDPGLGRRLGLGARARVTRWFLGPRALSQYAELIARLCD